ncbi:MAG: hypothetical protein WC055_15570 [Melioribacteraceae bacterium]
MKLIDVRFQYQNKNSKEIIFSEKVNLDIPIKSKTQLISSDSNLLYALGSILTGQSEPSEGDITGLNKSESILIIPEFAAFPWMTVKENILSVSEKIDDKLLQEFGLDIYLKNSFDENSYGFRLKLALIMALMAGKTNIVLFNPFSYIKTSFYSIFIRDIEKLINKGINVIILSSGIKKELEFDNEYYL